MTRPSDVLADPLSPTELLLHSKALEPLSDEAKTELSRIVALRHLDTYSEADVREEVITPILRCLGYAKESWASPTREKSLRILDKRLSADYSITLWQEHFWVIEAKKPNVTRGQFGYDQLWQAVQYAVHPEINASLVVLCDGHAIEVFDREASLDRPILRMERADLLRDFDQLRILLGPLQAWFMQKRRVARLVDKVFDRESQLGRLTEFRELIDRRLRSKEQQTIQNRRELALTRDDDAEIRQIRSAEPIDIVEGAFHFPMPWPMLEAASDALCESGGEWPFSVMYRIFPDQPRAVNDHFYVHALHYLLRLRETVSDLSWLPHWLGQRNGGGATVEQAVSRLTSLCLTHFAEDQPRKIILLYACAVRRLTKTLLVTVPQLERSGETAHAIQRHLGNEFDFAQLVSSPSRHLLLNLDRIENLAVHRFVKQTAPEQGTFRIEAAKLELRTLWQFEKAILASVPDYPALLRERDLGEIHPTEAAAVRYDNLGHGALCVLERNPEWRARALADHYAEVEALAALGSWQAREWLGLDTENSPKATEQSIADRFFLGDVQMSTALRDGYGWR